MFEVFNAPEPVVVHKKPNYGKVIAITAITVAVVEAAVIAAIFIIKKVRDSKIEKPHHAYDDGFDTVPNVDEVHVEFEE